MKKENAKNLNWNFVADFLWTEFENKLLCWFWRCEEFDEMQKKRRKKYLELIEKTLKFALKDGIKISQKMQKVCFK